METTVNIPAKIQLTIYRKEVQANGKIFPVYETLDTHKNRVSVSFTQTGKKAPEPEEFPVLIECINGEDIWEDKRKRYPVYRIRNYTVIATKQRKQNRGIKLD